MTVAELIEKLQLLDPTLPVVVRGYEAGVNDIERADVCYIQRDAYDEWYYGQHDKQLRPDAEHNVLAYELVGQNNKIGGK